MKNSHFNESEQFKNNYKQRITEVAEKKTEWLKAFVESHKPKPKVVTVGDVINETKKMTLISKDSFEEYNKLKFQESILNKGK